MSGPLVVAGHLNTTEFQPEFDEVLDVGLDDAIDSLGRLGSLLSLSLSL